MVKKNGVNLFAFECAVEGCDHAILKLKVERGPTVRDKILKHIKEDHTEVWQKIMKGIDLEPYTKK